MAREFAIGDIHGCCKTFKRLLLEKIQLRKSDKIYCIGDYIDRGNDSKGVLDFILELRRIGYQIHTLRGNHEQMMMDALSSVSKLQHWLSNGGIDTMESFGLKSVNEIASEYVSFLKRTKYYIKTSKYIFVHAGLNFKKSNLFEDKEAMLWMRNFSPDQPALGTQLLIHGHTPISLDAILSQQGNCFNIDGGCVFTEHRHLGKLVALNLTERKFISINNCD